MKRAKAKRGRKKQNNETTLTFLGMQVLDMS
jgi:hypothetical protein